jgi:peptide/nickel transport system permease protein
MEQAGRLDATQRTAPQSNTKRARLLRHFGFVAGATILLLVVLGSVFAPLLSPYDPYEQDLLDRMTPPAFMDGGSMAHPLGTDKFGRDYLSRLLYGGRLSLFVGVVAAAIAGLIGTVLGVAAGYFGGWTDRVINFLITGRLALPVILVSLTVVALFGASLFVVVTVLGLVLWDRFALVLRATTQQIRNSDFVTAAKLQGGSPLQVILREIMPNVVNNLIVVTTLEIAHAISLEAALSFLGLGVPPPVPSWGLMVAEGKEFILFDSWLITIPGVLLFLLVLSFNLVGDSLRDVFAPEARNT